MRNRSVPVSVKHPAQPPRLEWWKGMDMITFRDPVVSDALVTARRLRSGRVVLTIRGDPIAALHALMPSIRNQVERLPDFAKPRVRRG